MLKRLLLFIAFFALTVLIYRNGLHIPYYLDDYEHVFTNPQPEILHSFFQANSYAHFYRPIERSVLALIQTYWGWDTFPIRLLHLFLHSIGALLVFHALRKWKINNICAVSGVVLVIVSQLSVYAIASNDTQSQVEGALFSAFSLWLLYRYLSSEKKERWKYAISIITFFLALLSKETSAGLILAVSFLVFSLQDYSNSLLSRIKQAFLLILPFGICFLLYWMIRIIAGGAFPVIGGGSYSFHFGFNIIKNIGLFLTQFSLPVSSMTVMRTIYYKEYLLLALIFLYSGIFAFFFGYALWKSPRRKLVVGMVILMFCSWIPALFLESISELYPYNSVIYLGALFAIAAEYYFAPDRSVFLRISAGIVFLLALITNALGTDEKTSSMKRMGDRADVFIPQIISNAKILPLNSVMYLVNPKDSVFKYAEFSMKGFKVIAGCDSLVRYYAHRLDFQYFIADSADCAANAIEHPGVAYNFDPATLHIYPIEPNFTAPVTK